MRDTQDPPTYDVQSIVFPRPQFTPAEAEGWASLHGFDHGSIEAGNEWIHVHHRPLRCFDVRSLHPIVLVAVDDVRAVVGRQIGAVAPASEALVYLHTLEERERYERCSERLRFRAIMRLTRVAQGADSSGNQDLVAWYQKWFFETHRGASRREKDVAKAISDGLGQATRTHALDYVDKLGRGSSE